MKKILVKIGIKVGITVCMLGVMWCLLMHAADVLNAM